MKSQDIIKLESDNSSRIFLFLEGKFWRAYEKSAYQICTHIREFKPIKKTQKVLYGKSLVMIGFPVSTLDSVLKGQNLIAMGDKQIVIKSPSPVSQEEYEAWKLSIPEFKNEAKAKDKLNLPPSHEHAPAYSSAWEIYKSLYDEPCIESIRRDYKFSLLEELRKDMTAIVSNIYAACYTKDKLPILDDMVIGLFPVRVRLKLMYEINLIPEEFYLRLNSLMESLSSQLTGWRGKVSARDRKSAGESPFTAGITGVNDLVSEP